MEVGTAVGHSALLMGRAMPAGCHLTTIEKYEKRLPIARENFRRAGMEDRITLLEGDAEGDPGGPYGNLGFYFMDAARTVPPLAAHAASADAGGGSPDF